MGELTSLPPAKIERARFSLLQLVALLTGVGSAFALYFVLLSPPIGSSGLEYAVIPGFFLVVAIWLACSTAIKRLATYAVVAAFMSGALFLAYFSRTDWLMGHTLGPPQLVIAAFASAVAGVLAGLVWGASKLASRPMGVTEITNEAAAASSMPAWLGSAGVVLCTLF
jgi:hypothetical protein